MADLDNQTEEALGWAAEGKKLSVDIPEVSFKDAGTFVASMTPIIGDAMAAKDVYDELQKDEPNYYLAGALGGAALVGLVPGLGDAAAKAIKKGAKEVFDVAKRVEVDPNAMGSGLGNVRLAPKQPKKTVKAYKLFTKGEDGKLYPLFVDADTEVPTGTWLDATFPDYRFTAENGKQYVPSRGTAGKKGTGDSIKIPDQETRERLIEAGFLPKGSKAKSVKAVAARPGWHAGDVPIATHIGPETKINGKSVKYRGEDQVWAEVEMPADVDWQKIANSKARIKKDGTPDVRTADINDEMPSMGHYRYKTNPNMTGEWLIGGEMKVNRVLSREEVNAINEAAGVKDLPTLDELNKGYSKGGVVMDDYQYAEMMQGEDDQTRQAFAIGGLAEDVDPVSGNEVPIGSMPEEVRDDIPAQLSEGEYVVPADVVRFFGVKFFEDIRNEAKRGFADMEANGRIGGEPVGETGMEMGGDELPFDVSELQMVEGSSEEQPMMNQGGFISGYAEGGSAALPYHVATGSDSSGFEIRTFIGADGTKYYIQFMNGKPLTPIPDGATQEATAAEQVATQVETAAATGTATSNDNDSTPPPPPAEAIDWSDPTVATPEKFLSTYEGLEGMGTGLSFGAGLMLGPLAGLGVKGLMKLQKNSMLKGLDSQIESLTNTGNTSQVKKLEEIRNLMQGKNADGSEKKGAPTGIDVLTSGETYKGNSITESLANILTKGDGKSYRNGVLVDDVTGAVLEPGFANSTSNDPVSTPTSQPTAQPSQNNGGGNDNDTHTSAMRAAKAAAKAKTASQPKETQVAKASAAVKEREEAASADPRNMNKGGLMKKKK